MSANRVSLMDQFGQKSNELLLPEDEFASSFEPVEAVD